MAGEVTNVELLLTRGRALGISFVIVENVPSEISRAARVSAHLLAAFCTTGTELRAAAELLGLMDRREAERIQNLGKGECVVVLTGDRCPAPLHLRLPKPSFDGRSLSRQEWEFYMARSLQDLLPGVIPRYAGFIEQRQEVKQHERDPNRLSYNAWRVFVHIADNPTVEIEERCGALGMNRGEEEAGRKEGMLKGYLQDAGTFGRGVKLFALTPKGLAFSEEHNVPVRKFKSSVLHEALLQRVMIGVSKALPRIRWTAPGGTTGGTQPDGYGLLPGGRALCLQIHWKNKDDYEVQRLMDLCRIEHVDLILLVAPTKKAVDAVELAISKQWRADVPKRYVLLSATDCLAPDFDWMTVMERPT